MRRMYLIIKLTVVVFINCLPMLCYSNQIGDYFDNLPEEIILSFNKSYLDQPYIIEIDRDKGKEEVIYIYPDYTQIICNLPDGQSDTIWIETEANTYICNNDDGKREKIDTYTIYSPHIDFENPTYTTKEVKGRMVTYISDARYPEDAITKGYEGEISATCIVEKDGSLSNIILKENICPSIDREAYRILSNTKLIPCKLGNKTFRCYYNIVLLFSIDKYRVKDIGRVSLGKVENLPNGVSKRLRHGLRHGIIGSEVWNTWLEIDIPENNKNLEQLLCQTLFNMGGTSIEKTGHKYAEAFKGKIKNYEFKDKKGNKVTITAHVLGFKKDKYYSYVYTTELQNSSDTQLYIDANENSITHNILYDIQENRILSPTDIFTPSYLEELSNDMGYSDLKTLEIGMDDFFLYIGRKEDETITTISLCQDNWNKFTPIMQNILGNKANLPLFFNENDFEYDKEPNYTKEYEEEEAEAEEGVMKLTITRKFDGLKTKREGIQPVGIRKSIIRKPTIGSNESLLHEYLSEIWRKNEIHPDSDGFVANISFVINKNQTISNFQAELKKGDVKLYQKFVDLIKNNSKWRPMIFAIDGPAKSYFNYDIEIGGKVYDYVDIMPEFPGGYPALFQWISNEINIPDDVTETSLKKVKRILISCIIEEDGSVSNAKIETSIDDYLKKEIERVLAIMPKWIPGKRYGKESRVKTIIPLKINIVH